MANDYAMATKARALYSNHLNAQQYSQLLDLNTVGEIAGYLKSQTRYASVLEGVNEEAIHRDYLEQRIRSIALIEFSSLMRYVKTDKHHFYQFFIRRLEIDQLIFVLHAIESNTSHHYGKLLNELNHLMVFDLDALMLCTNYTQVLDVLKDTEYRAVLGMLSSGDVDLSKAEDNLQNHYNQSMLALIRKEESDDELLDEFMMQLELENIALVYRLKKYFEVPIEDMLPRLEGPFLHVNKKTLESWIRDLNGEEILQALEQTWYAKYGPFDGDHHIEYYFDMIRHDSLRKKIRLSTNTDVVLFAYMGLVTIEIKNIIDVIEGVRYHMPSNDIAKLLIY